MRIRKPILTLLLSLFFIICLFFNNIFVSFLLAIAVFSALFILLSARKWVIITLFSCCCIGFYGFFPIIHDGINLFIFGRKQFIGNYHTIAQTFQAGLFGIWCCIAGYGWRNLSRRKWAAYHVVFFVLQMGCFFAFSNTLHVTHYTMAPRTINSAGKPITIAHIADLHSQIYPNNQQDLIDSIQAIKPDLIFLTGDIADDEVPFEGTRLLLEGIQHIAPCFYVTGNHEFWDKDFYRIKQKIQEFTLTYLSDNFVYVDVNGRKVLIAGIDDPYRYMHKKGDLSFEQRFKQLNDSIDFDGLKLLLSHRPEKADLYQQSAFDAIFTGHTHGGQIRIPGLLNGFYAPNQGFFPPYAGGLYYLSPNTALVVSRGLTYSGLPRIFNPPELVVVTLY